MEGSWPKGRVISSRVESFGKRGALARRSWTLLHDTELLEAARLFASWFVAESKMFPIGLGERTAALILSCVLERKKKKKKLGEGLFYFVDDEG